MRKDAPSPEELLAEAHERLAAAHVLLDAGFPADALGRAYYAMLFAARALLAARRLFPRTHKGVVAQFGLEFVKKGYVEELDLQALAGTRERREDADYGGIYKVSEEEAEAALEQATRFLARIGTALSALKG